MTNQPNEAGRSGKSVTDAETSGGWEKKSFVGQRAKNQALASENCSETIQRWFQESKDVAPWNAIESFRPIALARVTNASKGETSTTGATAGSKTSTSKK